MDNSLMLSMLKRSLSPIEVVSGIDTLRRLQTLPIGKALLVTGSSSHTLGFFDRAMDLLQKGGNVPESVTLEAEEPTISLVHVVADQMRSVKPKWIIALGGGRVMDVTKLAWANYEHEELDFSCPPPLKIPPFKQKAKLIAIPTTSGSGAEASQVAVLKNETDGSILPYVSPEWIPEIVILDPRLTIELPPVLTAHTGMDALSHAVESYVSRLSGRYVQINSASALRLILESLPIVYSKPDDLSARENMMVASYLAGLCQSSASTGLAHALTHASTAIIGSSHGAGNALFLFPSMCLNKKKNNMPFLSLAKDSGYDLNELFASIQELIAILSLPKNLSDISRVVMNLSVCSDIAEKAMKDVCMRTNPQKLHDNDVISLLEALA
ncbi:iron-containing alcohol dehydrogenase [Methylotuvimicrobium sp.]|uniref:iron-containing alcohol dehydrogenase n=1 Tax=Methylotuvimicrobium sp. TaxID=2822413 RepID=UPI003D649E8A